jgi:glucose/mannose-6-phosphate isomerase
MNILDQPDKWDALDPGGMYNRIYGFPEQVAEAVQIGGDADVPKPARGKIRNIVVAGLGGSAIGGDLVRTYLAEWLKVPMIVVRDYVLPAFVDEHTLVLVSSYSGNTEETLSAYSQAQEQGAKLLVFTTGGKLAERAKKDGHPVVTLPGGLMPRAALGYSFFPMLIALERMGLAPDQEAAITETRELLAERTSLLSRTSSQENNPAKQAASAWHRHIPIIYGGTVRFDAVAYRIKCQIAENAKQLAFVNVFPEFNHNELVGYGRTWRIGCRSVSCATRETIGAPGSAWRSSAR